MINNKKVLCIVIARADSKGVPGKNVRLLLNKPLVQWSMEASLESKYVDITAVSSNCQEVQRIYLDRIRSMEIPSHNFMFIMRPKRYATDTSPNEEALIHTISQLKLFRDWEPDIVVHLQPTSPCRTDGLLDRCIEKYIEGDYDSLLTGTKETPFIWQRIDGEWKYTVDKNDCCDRKMRQEFYESEFILHDSGNIYITDKNVLLETKCRIGKKPYVFETTGVNNLQIDEEDDFLLIENMIKAKKLEGLI